MIWLLLALAIAANIAALVGIAAWYRQDRDALHVQVIEARADLLEARTDLDMEREVSRETAKRTARKERQAADDRVLATVEAFRRNLDEHDAAFVCLPGIDAIRGGHYTPTAGDTPLYDAEAVVVPIRGQR